MAITLPYTDGGNKSLKEKVRVLIERADENLNSAKLLLKEGFNDAAVSRAYYSMYYAAESLLLTKNLTFSSHKGVISKFGLNFVKTGIFPPQIGRDFNNAFQDRSLGDYGLKSNVTIEIAEKAVDRSEVFIKTLKEYLKQEGFDIKS